jgi:hypothetical protein
MLVVGSIVIRGVRDLARQRAFWSSALDYVARDPEEYNDDGVVLRPRVGNGPNLTLDTARAELQAPPPRIHLDLYAADQHAEVNRLKELGATEVEWTRPEGADFVVMADPEGNRFCVIDKAQMFAEG